MKTRPLFLVAVPFLLIGIILPPATAQLGRLPGLQPAFQVTTSYALPPARAQQTVYRLVPQLISGQDVADRVGLLGLQGIGPNQIQQVEDGFAVSDGTWDYTLDTERQFESLLDHRVMTGQTGYSPVIPTVEQCRQLALQFLANNNLVEGTRYERLSYERTNEILRAFVRLEDSGQPPGNPRVVLREVVFGKYIGSTPVIGAGSQVSVFIGDRGQVVGFMSNWMPTVPTGQRLDVVPPAQAAELLKSQLATANQSLPDPKLQLHQVSAKACRYALQGFTNKQGQQVLMPIYQFRGQLTDKRNRTCDFTYRVLAPQNLAEVKRSLDLTIPPALQPPPLLQQPIVPKMLPRGVIIKRVPPSQQPLH